jgi:hypothetical protein
MNWGAKSEALHLRPTGAGRHRRVAAVNTSSAWIRLSKAGALLAVLVSLGAVAQEVRVKDLDRQLRSSVEEKLKQMASTAGVPIDVDNMTMASTDKGSAALAIRTDAGKIHDEDLERGARVGVLWLSATASSGDVRIPAGVYTVEIVREKEGHSRVHARLLDADGKTVASLQGSTAKTTLPPSHIEIGGCDYFLRAGGGLICFMRVCEGESPGFSVMAWCIDFK